MEEMTKKKFDKMVLAKDDNLCVIDKNDTKVEVLDTFDVICKKCGTKLDRLVLNDNCGYAESCNWGEVSLLFKCNNCGNAKGILTHDNNY